MFVAQQHDRADRSIKLNGEEIGVPETHSAYLIAREDVFRRMYALTAIDHSDRSHYEFGEFYPDR